MEDLEKILKEEETTKEYRISVPEDTEIVHMGDIHGAYDFIQDIEPGDNRILVFHGDYIDRGKDSRLVVKRIRELQENNDNVIALMGNHEDMLIDYWRGLDSHWTFNGGYATMDSYEGYYSQLKSDVEWMRTLPVYYEDEHFVYVHGGLNVDKSLDEQDRYTMLWIRDPFIWNVQPYHKKVVFGHTPTITIK
jgi:serine/threonine protein phosphatase 1